MSDDATATSGPDRRALLRYVAAGVVIVAFVALAGLAIAASRSSLSIGLPAVAERAVEPSSDQVVFAAPDLAASTRPTDTPVAALPPTSVDAAADSAAPPATTDDTLPPPPALAPEATGKACPALGLSAPTDIGGLQSLIALIPLFGPFSPEAFAFLPAFEPGFSALGPLFPVFQQGLDQAAPLLTAITPAVQQLATAGFTTLAPLYGGERQAVLAAEKQLADQIAPLVLQFANAPGSECLVALEGLLASAVTQ